MLLEILYYTNCLTLSLNFIIIFKGLYYKLHKQNDLCCAVQLYTSTNNNNNNRSNCRYSTRKKNNNNIQHKNVLYPIYIFILLLFCNIYWNAVRMYVLFPHFRTQKLHEHTHIGYICIVIIYMVHFLSDRRAQFCVAHSHTNDDSGSIVRVSVHEYGHSYCFYKIYMKSRSPPHFHLLLQHTLYLCVYTNDTFAIYGLSIVYRRYFLA